MAAGPKFFRYNEDHEIENQNDFNYYLQSTIRPPTASRDKQIDIQDVSPWGEEDPDTILKNNETIKRSKHKRTSSLNATKTPEKPGALTKDNLNNEERRNVNIFDSKRGIDGTPLKEIEDT
jgi:hypothetical protein